MMKRNGFLLFIVGFIVCSNLFFFFLQTEIQTIDGELEENKKIINFKPKTSGDEINITTPENKTYTAPMSGYYPATYGFENDTIGNNPSNLIITEPPNTLIQVISELDDHKNVLEFYNNNDTFKSDE